MNVHAKIRPAQPDRPVEPQRRRFTADDLVAMEAAGILHPEENVELIDGEIVSMAAKTPRHEDMRFLLAKHFTDAGGRSVSIAQEPAFFLSASWEPEPDILVLSSSMLPSQARGDTALLVVEVAVTSLSHDLNIKAPMYAAHGVREYWVVDARRLVTHVHREPEPGGYARVQVLAADALLAPLLLPALALRLADLGFAPLAGDAV